MKNTQAYRRFLTDCLRGYLPLRTAKQPCSIYTCGKGVNPYSFLVAYSVFIRMKRMQLKHKIFLTLSVISGLVILGVFTHQIARTAGPNIFSRTSMLTALWEDYKRRYWEATTGRTIDHQRDGVTTSEGQSYTMLRAVWQDDQPTFDKSWQWTKEILQRNDDRLFAWLFGKRADGTFGVLTDQGGNNAASDGDTDIAYALLMAYARWGDRSYLEEARLIIADIWEHEVVIIGGKPYLAANNWEKQLQNDRILVNPSYFAPYAYRTFAVVDPEHNWDDLIQTSYDVLLQSIRASFSEAPGVLPPDWLVLDRTTAAVRRAEPNHRSDYSFDAMRIPWRIALDWVWYRSEDAKQVLQAMRFFSDAWKRDHALYTRYAHDGTPLERGEAPAIYGGSMGYFKVVEPALAKEVYKKKLRALYNPDTDTWKENLSYYDDNWAWFGVALYHDYLTNLAESTCRVPGMEVLVRSCPQAR